jgi:hypothetical protein
MTAIPSHRAGILVPGTKYRVLIKTIISRQDVKEQRSSVGLTKVGI